MKAADVFNRAADILDERGWGQGRYFEDYDACTAPCMLGACMAAAGEMTGHKAVYRKALNLLGLESLIHRYGPSRTPATWNDEPGRTMGEVQAMLRKVASASGDAECTALPANNEWFYR